MLNELVHKLFTARDVILSTHRNSDGDGIGSEIALGLALKKVGKNVRVINVDEPPRKYSYLKGFDFIEVFNPALAVRDLRADLAIVLDTNDIRLVDPLASSLNERGIQTFFVDHHPLLTTGPRPEANSWIQSESASTGELVYRLIKDLFSRYELDLDIDISRALYTSVVFDTQLFRFVRSSPNSHLMAADLLRYDIEPERIHNSLFATYTVEKFKFLTRALQRVEYSSLNRIGFVYLPSEDFIGIARDDSGEVIDMMMNVETVEVAALIREEQDGLYKVSLRSKGALSVLPVAESLGGGGHRVAAGAYVNKSLPELRSQILVQLGEIIAKSEHSPRRESR